MVVEILLMLAHCTTFVSRTCNRISYYLLQKAEEILDG